MAAIKLKARFVYLQAHVLYCQVTLPFIFFNEVISFINARAKGPRLWLQGSPWGCRLQSWPAVKTRVQKQVTDKAPASGSRCCCELMSETVMNGFCQGNIVLWLKSSLLFLAVRALAQRSGDWTPQATKSALHSFNKIVSMAICFIASVSIYPLPAFWRLC